MLIGLFQRVEGRYFWPLYHGAVDAAEQAGASIIVYLSPTPKHQRELSADTLKQDFLFDQKRFDGLMFGYGSEAMQEYAGQLWSEGFPVVLLGRRHASVPCVVNDGVTPIRKLVTELAGRGHRRIGFVEGLPGNFGAEERCVGYHLGLKDCGIAEDPALIVSGYYSEETTRENVRTAIERGADATAWIGADDRSGFGVLDAMHDLGVRVPDEVEVVGFDNVAATKWSNPPLSTFEPQLYEIGYVGTQELIRMIGGKVPQPEILVPTIYRGRASTRDRKEVETERQFGVDWVENQFCYEVQWNNFCRIPNVAAVVGEMEASVEDPERFLANFRKLLYQAKERKVDPSCIDAFLHGMGERIASIIGDVSDLATPEPWFDKALALQTGAMFEEQTRRYEITIHYQAAITRLRELTFEAAEEPLVLARLWQAVRTLNIGRMGLYLHCDKSLPQAGDGHPMGRWMWKDALRGPRQKDPEGERTEAMDLFDLHPGFGVGMWVVIPLLYEQEVLGVMVFESDMDFVLHYPELANQFSVGLHGARMHFALERTHAELVEASRQAGVAEMATGVLHNIGNALNSVNTAVGLISSRVQKSKIGSVGKLAQLLSGHKEDLERFLREDPKGRQVIGYIEQLAVHLGDEQKAAIEDLEDLRFKVDYINQIVAAQQDYTQYSGVSEAVNAESLIEQALKIAEASLLRHHVEVQRVLGIDCVVFGERQKILQILVNLIRNAKDAVGGLPEGERRIVLSLEKMSEGKVRLSVKDNGVGIPPENLVRIFAFGFSTKPNGRGFGLHASALAAKEMGGLLEAESAGEGKGATFHLTLPSSAKA